MRPVGQVESNEAVRELPAATTVDIGNLSREDKKDIKNGMRLIWLMASRALFEVSLIILRNNNTLGGAKIPTTSTTRW